MRIESEQNPKIKNLQKLLSKSRERKKNKLFVVEGLQENKLALEGGYEPESFFISEDIFDSNNLAIPSQIDPYWIPKTLFSKLVYRESTGGILGIYRERKFGLEDLASKKEATLIILESIEKPGNLGAILRTADATSIDAIILTDDKVDFFNPNVIRSSVGTVFTNTLLKVEKETLVQWLSEKEYNLYITHLQEDSTNLFRSNFSKKTALLFGTESTGVSNFWINKGFDFLKIPMLGKVDSLNVSNSVAVCLYELLRQKGRI